MAILFCMAPAREGKRLFLNFEMFLFLALARVFTVCHVRSVVGRVLLVGWGSDMALFWIFYVWLP